MKGHRQFFRHITPHRLSGTQEDRVATETKRANCFPFCDECTSACYSGESAPLLLPQCIHHRRQSMTNDTHFLPFCLLLFLSAVPLLQISFSRSLSLCWHLAAETLHFVSKRNRPAERGLHLAPAVEALLRFIQFSEQRCSSNLPGREDDLTN